MIYHDLIAEVIKAFPGILHGLACIILSVLLPAALVKSIKAYSASMSAQKGGRDA